MKAITCSQCGALIKNFKIGDRFADCEYCLAKIPVIKDKVLDIKEEPKKKSEVWVSPYDQYVAKKAKYSSNLDPEPQSNILGLFIVVGGMIVLVVFIGVVLIRSLAPNGEGFRRDDSGTGTRAVPAESYEGGTYTESTPLPNVSFTSYVKYNTSLGAEHIELPTIEADQLPTYDHEELKTTVFKEKRIQVKISINTEGEVTEASALNGHEVLRTSSVNAAKKSLFSPRKREGKSTLTYIYLLVEE